MNLYVIRLRLRALVKRIINAAAVAFTNDLDAAVKSLTAATARLNRAVERNVARMNREIDARIASYTYEKEVQDRELAFRMASSDREQAIKADTDRAVRIRARIDELLK